VNLKKSSWERFIRIDILFVVFVVGGGVCGGGGGGGGVEWED
jgi:hypothetical protein